MRGPGASPSKKAGGHGIQSHGLRSHPVENRVYAPRNLFVAIGVSGPIRRLAGCTVPDASSVRRSELYLAIMGNRVARDRSGTQSRTESRCTLALAPLRISPTGIRSCRPPSADPVNATSEESTSVRPRDWLLDFQGCGCCRAWPAFVGGGRFWLVRQRASAVDVHSTFETGARRSALSQRSLGTQWSDAQLAWTGNLRGASLATRIEMSPAGSTSVPGIAGQAVRKILAERTEYHPTGT